MQKLQISRSLTPSEFKDGVSRGILWMSDMSTQPARYFLTTDSEDADLMKFATEHRLGASGKPFTMKGFRERGVRSPVSRSSRHDRANFRMLNSGADLDGYTDDEVGEIVSDLISRYSPNGETGITRADVIATIDRAFDEFCQRERAASIDVTGTYEETRRAIDSIVDELLPTGPIPCADKLSSAKERRAANVINRILGS